MTQKIIAQGAEAIIYLVSPLSKKSSSLINSKRRNLAKPVSKQSISSEASEFIIKDRIKKSYRIPELDDKIRKQRTKAEKKLLEKASKIINAPDPFPLKEFNKIEMPYLNGKKLSDNLDSFPLKKQKQILRQIGKDVAKLHDANIIHGDLTTSNMILVEDKIFFIDFGLGFISHKFEDKAVDVHLLKQALEAKHFKNWKILYQEFAKGYKSTNKEQAEKTLNQMIKVEKRGRYKS